MCERIYPGLSLEYTTCCLKPGCLFRRAAICEIIDYSRNFGRNGSSRDQLQRGQFSFLVVRCLVGNIDDTVNSSHFQSYLVHRCNRPWVLPLLNITSVLARIIKPPLNLRHEARLQLPPRPRAVILRIAVNYNWTLNDFIDLSG